MLSLPLHLSFADRSGHGSLWRVEALRGADVDGRRYADPTNYTKVGKHLGFRSQMVRD